MWHLNAYHPRLASVSGDLSVSSCYHNFFWQLKIHFQFSVEYTKVAYWDCDTTRTFSSLCNLNSYNDEKNDRDASKPVLPHFNLSRNSTRNIIIYVLSLYQGNTDSRKNIEQKFIF